jgi:hypothetical protein
MAGKTLDIETVLSPDQIGCEIAKQFQSWDNLRANRKVAWEEIQRYIYSTDTTTTTNSKLQWKNKTTLPKLCQIRDNLYANYIASLFPKSDFVEWQGADQGEQTAAKTALMESYTEYFLNEPSNKEVLYKCILDYIDYGNAFLMVDWKDNTTERSASIATGYIGPQFVRINPSDIVFNPVAPSFQDSPKIIRSILTIGELKKEIESNSISDQYQEAITCFEYLRGIRTRAANHNGAFTSRNAMYAVDGFTSFDVYLKSNYVELLTFYGDYYDIHGDKFYANAIITVADRHKVLSVKENPSTISYNKIHHIGWRPRQDNV